MSDPRNAAHDKKVKQQKEHQHDSTKDPEVAVQHHAVETIAVPLEGVVDEQAAIHLEKSMAVLSKLKEMEFHSRANIQTIAALMLTVEDELKQKEFSEPVGDLYSAQDSFQTRITALIERYGAACAV